MVSTPYSAATLRLIQKALGCARAGDVAGTRAAAESGLRTGEAREIFGALLGRLECQAGNFMAGIAHFRAALQARPDDVAVRCSLVRALADNGDPQAALAMCTDALAQADGSRRLLRLRAWLLQHAGDLSQAMMAYRQLIAADAGDFESWNNLGNALAAEGDARAALDALDTAMRLRPDNAPVRFNRAMALLQLGEFAQAEAALAAYVRDHPQDARPRRELAALCKMQGRDAEALAHLESAAALAKSDAELQIQLGLERQYAWQMEGAEAALRSALALKPALDEGWILLALHFEHTNRPEGISPLIPLARAAGTDAGTVRFLSALLCRREGRFAEGLAELAGVPDALEPVRVAQLRGQCHDRLGNAAQAFEAFTVMNRLQQADRTEPLRRAQEYREALARDRALVTPAWHASWRQEPRTAERRSPVFLLGFPRSGTTLLDTLLMGHPQVQVLEERPPLAQVERRVGGLASLPGLSAADITDLRTLYFEEAGRWVDLRDDAVLIDKFPLHLNKVPLIHRLFPDACFVLALRHPLDTLLSCYMTNFRLNSAMANFLDLDTAAWLYDQSFGFFEQCRQMMGVDCHPIMYERIVEDGGTELRPLFERLGLEWTDSVLDHRRTATGRGVITTASYAQVTEPIYTRARGRWERYREFLAPVLPVMQPWIDRHGYRA